MKSFLYLVMSLLIIAAIIPAASAVVKDAIVEIDPHDTYSTTPGSETYLKTWATTAEANSYCVAQGKNSYASIYWYYTSTGTFYPTVFVIPYVDKHMENSSWSAGTGTSDFTFNRSTYKAVVNSVSCWNTADHTGSGHYVEYIKGHYREDVAIDYPVSFTATPLTGNAPLAVLFTITNSTRMSSPDVIWSFGDGNVSSSSVGTISHQYQNQGNYTIIFDYTDLLGNASTVQKNNYIIVGSPNATAVTHAVARDLYTGFAIQNAEVDMYDVENTSWTNTTAINGEGSITTLLGHTINIWGSATGYEDDNLIGVPAVDGGYYSLLLRPTNLTTYTSTPGNLTLAVTVQDLQIPHQTLSGAEVTAAWGAQYASGTSNAAGSVFFIVPNNTAIHLSAFKSGYASGSSTHITGTANGGSTMETAIVYIGTDYVTPVPSVTLTTGPGGTIPQTVDPYPCIGDGSAQDTANCQRKQGSMAADLISYGPDLVKFFIMLTFIGGLLLITGKR